MPFDKCPSCGFAEAERTSVVDVITQEPLGEQLFCPKCRHFSPHAPSYIQDKAPLSSETRAKLLKLGLSNEEIDTLFAHALPPKKEKAG